MAKEQIAQLQSNEKGKIDFKVTVTDETNTIVAISKVTWAWFPKQVAHQNKRYIVKSTTYRTKNLTNSPSNS